MPNSTVATVDHTNPKNVPCLTPGTVTPEIMVSWFSACNTHFINRKTTDGDKVAAVIGGLQDPLIKAWYEPDFERLQKLSWADFQDEFKREFLPRNWEDKIETKLFAMRQGDGDAFRDFSNKIENLNLVLRGTTLHLDDEGLIRQVKVAMCSDLRGTVQSTTSLQTIKKYRQWKEEVAVLDEKRMNDRDRIIKLLTDNRSITNRVTTGGSRSNNPMTQNRGGSSSSSSTAPRLPKLTDAEKTLLGRHEGCFKCRQFYAGHLASQCTNAWPDAKSYRTLTETDATTAAAKRNKFSPKTVAAVTDLTTIQGNPVAAIGGSSPLAATSGVLAYGSDSEESDDECVSIPITVPHILWPAFIHNENGPTYPRNVTTLMDCGSSVVLIREDIVSCFELRRRRLHSPYPLGTAWGTEDRIATEWVKLRLSSPCRSWTSCTVRALVAPRLCAPVLLGRPFLKLNKLVADHELDYVIHKPTGIDILHIPPPTPPPPSLTPKERRIIERRNQTNQMKVNAEMRTKYGKELKQELRSYLRNNNIAQSIRRFNKAWELGRNRNWKLGKIKPVEIRVELTENNRKELTENERIGYCTIAAVRQRIEELSLLETLKEEDRKMKKKYADRFPDDIPHLDELPTSIYHRIRITDANLTISRRQYDCPKKYREAWKILLNQHLQAGRLRPSSSPYASPSFLIPKADPNALPRWVNDYRILNKATVPDRHPLPKISDILADCAKGKVWGKLDMTNSFSKRESIPTM